MLSAYQREDLESALIVALIVADNITKAQDTNDKSTLSYGICNEWEEVVEANGLDKHLLIDIRSELYSMWPKHSECRTYPIPMPDSMADEYHDYCEECDYTPDGPSEWMYDNTDDMWNGEYGASRWACLDYMIDTLTEATA